MLYVARAIASLWVQRWQALKADEGASTLEYAVLIAVGIAAATAIGLVIEAAVKSRSAGFAQ